MASTTVVSQLCSPTTSTLVDTKAPPLRPSQSISLSQSQSQSQSQSSKTSAICRRSTRNVVAMATGEAPAEPAAATELPGFVKTIQEAWDKVEDKYAVSSLAAAGVVALWGSTGVISAIDKLPLLPGVLELVGIGYSGWFAYKNLIFKPDREALIQKVTDAYKDIIGSS